MKKPLWKVLQRLELSRTENKLKLIILIIGLVLLLGLSFATANRLTMSSEFCSTCHEMTPEYVTWQASSHSNISCISCHKTNPVKELYSHFTDSYNKPIKISQQITQDVCKQCHSNHRSYTYTGDLIVPHDKHSAKNIPCVACHTGVAHGNIAEKGLTNDNKQVWSTTFAAEQMKEQYTQPKMSTCLDCHAKRGVTQKCETCHTSIVEPADHKAADWKEIHGHKAAGDLGYCIKCHSAVDDKPNITLAEYARSKEFCVSCHQKRPAGHGQDWLSMHSSKALADKASCLVCHNENKQEAENTVAQTYCYQCHGDKDDGKTDKEGLTPSAGKAANRQDGAFAYHDSGWRQSHPAYIKENGIQKGKCYSCHEPAQCSKCHTSQGKLH